MNKKVVQESENIDVVDPNKSGLELNDATLEKAEASTSNLPPRGEDPLIHLKNNVTRQNIPPLNVRVQGGDYSGAPTCVDKLTEEDGAEALGDYADDDPNEDIMDPQSNLMSKPMIPKTIPNKSTTVPTYTDFIAIT